MREREGGWTRLARGEEEKKNEVGEGRRGEKKKQGSPSAMATFSFSNFGLKLGAGHAAFAGASAPCWTFISLAGIASGSEPALGSPLARAKKRGKASRRRPAAPPGVSGITPEGLAFMTSPGELDAVFLVVLEEEEVLAASSRCRRGDLGGKRKGGKKNSLSLSLSLTMAWTRRRTSPEEACATFRSAGARTGPRSLRPGPPPGGAGGRQRP